MLRFEIAMWNEHCQADCDYGDSVTSAHIDLGFVNSASMSDAYQFGDPDDTTWDLNGCTFAMDVQVTYYDQAPKLSLSSAAGTIVVADVIQRVIYLSVPAASVAAALIPGQYVYDLIMTDAHGTKTALMHGKLSISQGVTGV